jgi:NAD(P)-dependent dehydrogenase (short-subunit alcohol dehydrogenase family)
MRADRITSALETCKEHIMVAHPNGTKVALITGANRGIGFEVARQLGRRGMVVIIGAFGRLDVLVNNAGVVLDRGMPPSQVPLDVLRRTYETNVFGPVAVMQAFLPLLKQSEAGRIVNASTELASLAQNTNPDFEFYHIKLLAYNSSKTALNAVTMQFAHELKDTPIKVNAADPGYTATDFNNHSGTQTVEQGARVVVQLATLPGSGPTGGYFNADGPLPW